VQIKIIVAVVAFFIGCGVDSAEQHEPLCSDLGCLQGEFTCGDFGCSCDKAPEIDSCDPTPTCAELLSFDACQLVTCDPELELCYCHGRGILSIACTDGIAGTGDPNP
jgi:hypothetical protein